MLFYLKFIFVTDNIQLITFSSFFVHAFLCLTEKCNKLLRAKNCFVLLLNNKNNFSSNYSTITHNCNTQLRIRNVYLFYFYIYPPDSQESDGGANT